MTSVLYPGSFDPLTNGHIDVILRLKKIFDHVVVLVSENPRKSYWFSSEERVQMVRESFSATAGVEAVASSDLTVHFAKKRGIGVIARSARTVSDWEYEYAMADANRKLAPEIETLFIMADPQYGFISSSLVREVALFGGDTSVFVPPHVVKALRKRGEK